MPSILASSEIKHECQGIILECNFFNTHVSESASVLTEDFLLRRHFKRLWLVCNSNKFPCLIIGNNAFYKFKNEINWLYQIFSVLNVIEFLTKLPIFRYESIGNEFHAQAVIRYGTNRFVRLIKFALIKLGFSFSNYYLLHITMLTSVKDDYLWPTKTNQIFRLINQI